MTEKGFKNLTEKKEKLIWWTGLFVPPRDWDGLLGFFKKKKKKTLSPIVLQKKLKWPDLEQTCYSRMNTSEPFAALRAIGICRYICCPFLLMVNSNNIALLLQNPLIQIVNLSFVGENNVCQEGDIPRRFFCVFAFTSKYIPGKKARIYVKCIGF